jgi:hypothetical protein
MQASASESQLVVFNSSTPGNNYVVCLTDKRLVAISKKSKPILTKGLAGRVLDTVVFYGIIGGGVDLMMQSYQRSKDALPENLDLDALLEADKKHNYAIPYTEVMWMKLNSDNLNVRGKKVWKIFKLRKETVEQLRQILPNLRGLEGKLVKD